MRMLAETACVCTHTTQRGPWITINFTHAGLFIYTISFSDMPIILPYRTQIFAHSQPPCIYSLPHDQDSTHLGLQALPHLFKEIQFCRCQHQKTLKSLHKRKSNRRDLFFFCAKQIFFTKSLWMTLLQILPCSENDFCLGISVLLQSPDAVSRAKSFFQDDSALMSCLICLLHNSSSSFTSSCFFLPVRGLFFNFTFSFLLYGYISPLLQAYNIFRAYPCIAHYPPSSYPFCFPILNLIFH